MSANPMLVEGQQVSGFQGLGGALLEEFCYSERGDPLSVTFADYLMPTAQEIPLVEIILTEDFPARSASRAPARAVLRPSARPSPTRVEDALGMPGAITGPPITPRRLKEILQSQVDR